MKTVFKFNRGMVTNTFKYNFGEGGPHLKKSIKFLYDKNNVCCQNLNENIKRCLIWSTRALDLLCQVRTCMPIYKMYVLHFNLSPYVH